MSHTNFTHSVSVSIRSYSPAKSISHCQTMIVNNTGPVSKLEMAKKVHAVAITVSCEISGGLTYK